MISIRIDACQGNKQTYHKRVNETVHKQEDPDRRSHILDPNEKTTTSSHMMVSLQSRALFPLQQDNSCIDEFVKLGDVEEPAVER
jgi:hypothetical protein